MVDICGATSAAFVERNSRHSGKLVSGCFRSVDGTMVCGDADDENWDAMNSSVLTFKFSHSGECQKSAACTLGSSDVC